MDIRSVWLDTSRGVGLGHVLMHEWEQTRARLWLAAGHLLVGRESGVMTVSGL